MHGEDGLSGVHPLFGAIAASGHPALAPCSAAVNFKSKKRELYPFEVNHLDAGGVFRIEVTRILAALVAVPVLEDAEAGDGLAVLPILRS